MIKYGDKYLSFWARGIVGVVYEREAKDVTVFHKVGEEITYHKVATRKEAYELAMELLGEWFPCPSRHNHHVYTTCKTCGQHG